MNYKLLLNLELITNYKLSLNYKLLLNCKLIICYVLTHMWKITCSGTSKALANMFNNSFCFLFSIWLASGGGGGGRNPSLSFSFRCGGLRGNSDKFAKPGIGRHTAKLYEKRDRRSTACRNMCAPSAMQKVQIKFNFNFNRIIK